MNWSVSVNIVLSVFPFGRKMVIILPQILSSGKNPVKEKKKLIPISISVLHFQDPDSVCCHKMVSIKSEVFFRIFVRHTI